MASNKKKSEFIDIKEVFATFKRKWYWFLISVIVCCGLAFIYTKISKPQYKVVANVLISQEDGGGMGNFGGLGDLFGSNGYVEDEIFVITSHSVLRDVVKDLGIYRTHIVRTGLLSKTFEYEKYPVDVYPSPGIVDTLRSAVVFKTKIHDGKADIKVLVSGDKIKELEDQPLPATVKCDYGQFVIDRTKYYPKGKDINTTITVMGYDAAAEDLAKVVSSSIASKKSNAINLSIVTPAPKYGLDILNTIIQKYNERGINQKNLQSSKTAAFIDERLALISGDLAGAESDIQNYKENQGIVDVQTEASYNISLKGEAERNLIAAQTENEIIKMTRDFINDPDKAYELIPSTNGVEGGSSKAIEEYNILLLKRLELMNNAKGNNTALKSLNDQIDAMRSSINTSLQRAYVNSNVKVKELASQVSKAQGKLGNIPTQERTFISLKRQQEVKQQLYLFLLQRREETAMILANAVPKGEIIDKAYTLSDPVSLSKYVVLLIALILGLCIPPIIIYIKKLLRTKFETRQDVENRVDLPILGEMCIDNSGDKLAVAANNTSSTSELFRLLRTNLQFVLNGKDEKVVLMTSTSSGEGKSFISINLAASLSLLNKKVILVGMDIRNPQLAKYLGLASHIGLTQYLADPEIKVDSLIMHDQLIEGLDIIQAGPIPPNPGELLASQAVDKLFAELREKYDYIIIDSAPVGMVSDTFHIVRVTDATLYVCRANYTQLRDLDYIETLQHDKRLKKISLIVNGTTAHKGYGYGYNSDNQKHRAKF